MLNLAKTLAVLAAIAFAGAVVTNFAGVFLTTAEGYSRASTNLALLAITLVVCFRDERL
jgi:hypothetical protein